MMSENVNSESEENLPKESEEIIALLKKMQHKLDSMEEKIDALTRQSVQRTFKGKPFSKPYKEFDKTNPMKRRKYEGKKEEVSSEGKFYHGRPFGKKKVGGESNIRKKKKPFNRSAKKYE